MQETILKIGRQYPSHPVEELLGQPEVSKIAEPEDTLSEESDEENEEQGMKLRSGTRKADTINKTVRFQTK
jgi:hypothetical protein